MEQCTSYQSYPFEYLLPSPVVLSTLCLSFDRTELFIMSTIRLFIWIIIFLMMSEEYDLNNHRIIRLFLYTMISMNMIYVGIVITKKPVISVGSNESVSSLEYK